MAYRIPTTQEIVDRNLANLESKLGQTAPIADKAFLRVLAIMEAMGETGLYRFAVERAKQNLALTANEDGLTVLGNEYGVPRKAAVAAQLDIQTAASPATSLPITASLTGDANSETYYPNATYNESGGVIQATVTAQTPGISGNLNPGDTLVLDEPITGVGNIWTVTAVAVEGLDQEDLESWRRRISLEIQTVGGGGNGVDYRTWAEETPGCYRAFPYTGAPVDTVAGFLDGGMEETGVYDWTVGNSATLTKDTTAPEEGAQCLRVAYNAVSDPYAYQSPLTINKYYRITGYARSNGVYIPSVKTAVSGGQTLWTGTNSVNWQAFDITFQADTADILFYSNCSGSGYVEFDSIDIVQISYPGDRSVFVEADSSLDPDGIAPPALLVSVRSYINTDPVTGKARPPLGEIDENLYVQSIVRNTFNVEIRDLVVDPAIEAETKATLEIEIDAYLRGATPYIDGVDPPATKNDIITDLTLSQVIQNTLDRVGGSAGGVGLFIEAGIFIPSYTLGQGELGKLGTVSYV
jgi:hypothetical protein